MMTDEEFREMNRALIVLYPASDSAVVRSLHACQDGLISGEEHQAFRNCYKKLVQQYPNDLRAINNGWALPQ